MKIKEGDILQSKWGYIVEVVKTPDGLIGRLVCCSNHSCSDIPYALNNGEGYEKISANDLFNIVKYKCSLVAQAIVSDDIRPQINKAIIEIQNA